MCLVLLCFLSHTAAPAQGNQSRLSSGAYVPTSAPLPCQGAMISGAARGTGSDPAAVSGCANPAFLNVPLVPQAGEELHRQQVLFLKGHLEQVPLIQRPATFQGYRQELRTPSAPGPPYSWNHNSGIQARRPPYKSWQTPKHSFQSRPRYDDRNSRSGLDRLATDFEGLTVSSQGVEQRLLKVLGQLRPGEFESARHLARKLDVQKKEVNHHLYRLLARGKLCKAGETPPLWRLADSPKPQRADKERSSTGWTDPRPVPAPEVQGEAAESSDWEDCLDSATMAEVKEKICNFLFSVTDSTALNLAKNIGLSKARDVSYSLGALEKLGDVRKENTNPPKWSLTDNKRKRMQLKVKAEEVREIAALQPDPEPPAPHVELELPASMPTPPPSSPPPPPPPAPAPSLPEDDKEKVENGQQVAEPTEPGDGSPPETGSPDSKRPRYHWFPNYDNFENGKWATDDIPEDLNAINNQDESRCIMESPLSPSYAAQFDTAFLCTPFEKLVACQKKNPVSGLIEYTQYTYQHCEFVLLKQSGPSHEPR